MRAAALVMLFFTCCAGLEPVLVQSLFAVRYDYVVTHLCENRDHPEHRCNGKCFLKKRMQDTHRDEETPQQVLLSGLTSLHLFAAPRLALPDRPAARHVYPSAYVFRLVAGISPDVIHPPEQAA